MALVPVHENENLVCAICSVGGLPGIAGYVGRLESGNMCVQLANLHIAVGEGFPSWRLFLILAFGLRSRAPEFRREQPVGA